jgi:pimeloyl-ACP methyl ester carboxylesterase
MTQGFVDTRHGCIHYVEEGAGKNNVAVLADCGHFPMIDDPALFVNEVDRLIKQVSR